VHVITGLAPDREHHQPRADQPAPGVSPAGLTQGEAAERHRRVVRRRLKLPRRLPRD